MSTRGIKFNFSPGELVLCFEPDPTKARVLYEAKILDTEVSRDPDGKRFPAYHVHFNGWNSSWDRIVTESFVLRNNEENRILMKQLAETAKSSRRNKSRKKKIYDLLHEAFEGKPPQFDSEGEDSEEETDTNDTGTEEESCEDSEDGSNSNKGDEKKREPVEFEIPEILKDKLSRDYLAIHKENKLVKLPAEPSVVMVLESFVKTFILDFWGSTFDRATFCHTAPKISIDRVLPMCKEFVDGVRIYFDFMLPLILLYSKERGQFDNVTEKFRTQSPIKEKSPEPVVEEESPVHSPRLRSMSRLRSKSIDEPSPKLPKLSPKVLSKEEEENIFPPQVETTPRRITRQSLVDSGKKLESTKEGTISSPEKRTREKHSAAQPSTSTSSVRETRSSDKRSAEAHKKDIKKSRNLSGGSSNETMQSRSDAHVNQKDTNGYTAQRADPPPPLLIPCNISSNLRENGTVTNGKPAPGSTDSMGDSGKEEIVDSVLSWQLLPPEVQSDLPTPPSLLYGAQHLMRLFVRFPDLLGRMNMEEQKLQVLLKLLKQFLHYLSEHHIELFPESSYVPAAEAV